MGRLTHGAEVEEQGQLPATGEPCTGLPQLVKESVGASLQRGQPCHRCVLQQAGAQRYGLWRGSRLEHLGGRDGVSTHSPKTEQDSRDGDLRDSLPSSRGVL